MIELPNLSHSKRIYLDRLNFISESKILKFKNYLEHFTVYLDTYQVAELLKNGYIDISKDSIIEGEDENV